MKESLLLLVNAVDNFGFVSEEFGMDLVNYEYSPTRPGNFKLLFENRFMFLSFTLERGQLYIHAGSTLYPDEPYSMLRLVRLISRRGGKLTNEEQDTDYWRHGSRVESQFALAAKQLERTLGMVAGMFSASELETTRAEMKNHGRPLEKGQEASI